MKKSGTTPGQIVKFEKAIDASSVMLICPFTDKPTRIGYVMVEEKGNNKKFRYSKKALSEK
jgi:large subunit ribosomal protein L24